MSGASATSESYLQAPGAGLRVATIAAGLLLAIASAGLTASTAALAVRARSSGVFQALVCHFAPAVDAFALGWCLFPLWVLGTKVDAKALPPALWLGKLWAYPIMAFITAWLPATLVLLGSLPVALLRRRWRCAAVLGTSLAVMGAALMILQWFLD